MDVTRQVNEIQMPESYYVEIENRQALDRLYTACKKFDKLEAEVDSILEKSC